MDKSVDGGKIRISVTVDNELYAEFKNYCEARGMKMSSKIEQLMKETVKNTSLRKFM